MIPASGAVTLAQVNAELGRSGTPIGLDDMAVRLLTCNPARLAPGSGISMADLRGKSGYAFTPYMASLGSGAVGARAYDGSNPWPFGTYSGRNIRELSTSARATTAVDGNLVTMFSLVGRSSYPDFFALGLWTASLTFVGYVRAAEALYYEGGAGGGVDDWLGVGWPASRLDLRAYAGTYLQAVVFYG